MGEISHPGAVRKQPASNHAHAGLLPRSTGDAIRLATAALRAAEQQDIAAELVDLEARLVLSEVFLECHQIDAAWEQLQAAWGCHCRTGMYRATPDGGLASSGARVAVAAGEFESSDMSSPRQVCFRLAGPADPLAVGNLHAILVDRLAEAARPRQPRRAWSPVSEIIQRTPPVGWPPKGGWARSWSYSRWKSAWVICSGGAAARPLPVSWLLVMVSASSVCSADAVRDGLAGALSRSGPVSS
jgi:hypothetical protein